MCMIDGMEEPYEAQAIETRRARKEHRCGECGRAIQPGEKYELARGLYDGRWDTHKTCAHCCAAREWLQRECGGWLFNGVAEDLSEHVTEYGWHTGWKSGALKVLVSAMARKWEGWTPERIAPLASTGGTPWVREVEPTNEEPPK